MSIKKLFFLCFIIFSSISLSAQCDCERVKDDVSGKCISTVNFYLTTTIPIYLNGVLIPLEQCENVLGAIRQEDLISVQRFKRKNRKKLERIEVITR